jgi:hypothetical protein
MELERKSGLCYAPGNRSAGAQVQLLLLFWGLGLKTIRIDVVVSPNVNATDQVTTEDTTVIYIHTYIDRGRDGYI